MVGCALIHKTTCLVDRDEAFSDPDEVSMCSYHANWLCDDAADRTMREHDGLGYSRHKPFDHVDRHN
jgi:alkylation response protein AidB-like acyl-CoA dehydrogenase